MSNIREYSEKTFCIDLISDFYQTVNPKKIIKFAKKDLDMTLTTGEILDYLYLEEDLEKENRFIQMKQIFNT